MLSLCSVDLAAHSTIVYKTLVLSARAGGRARARARVCVCVNCAWFMIESQPGYSCVQ